MALNLSLEVADILDELNMLDAVLGQQREVLDLLLDRDPLSKPGSWAEAFHEKASGTLDRTRNGVQRLRADALTAQTMVRSHFVAHHCRVFSVADMDWYTQLMNLLDLQQKAASLEEARSATKQGQAVMLFTIVTIIFVGLAVAANLGGRTWIARIANKLKLPLSFFTSYFGQNVREITGDENNPTSGALWKIGGVFPFHSLYE
jgi:hypothetical protein